MLKETLEKNKVKGLELFLIKQFPHDEHQFLYIFANISFIKLLVK